MANKKYELTDETIQHGGRTLHRIRALIDIPAIGVSVGDLGGYVESEKNLSHDGGAWVEDDARVYGHGRVYGNAHVSNAWVGGNACVFGEACVYGGQFK